MEKETLFTSAKWNILRALSTGKKSPIELAETANTSMSNISQSLRFLELAGIVQSERISNRDKGQPRVVYSLAKDNAYLIVTATGLVDKKLLELDEHKKIMVSIWLYDQEAQHPFIEKAYLNIQEHLPIIQGIYLDKTSLSELSIHITFKEGKKKDIKPISAEHNGLSRKVTYKSTTKEAIQKDKDSYYALHDPKNTIRG